MEDKRKYIGARIKELRKIKGLKQSELAELVGIDSKHMSKLECGRCFPSFDLLSKIAQILDKSIADFFVTEHLQSRDVLIKNFTMKLQKTSEDKFKLIYKIVNKIM